VEGAVDPVACRAVPGDRTAASVRGGDPVCGYCEVDDVEWVRCFTKHGGPRPAQARLISRRSPRPQRLPRHPQWPGPQGPHGTSHGSARTSGGRPQPHTQDAAPHTNLPRSSTFNGSPPKDLQTSTCSVIRQIQRLATYARASFPWGTAEVHFTAAIACLCALTDGPFPAGAFLRCRAM